MDEFKTDKYVYQVFADNKKIDDMKHVANEWVQFGYEKIKEISHDGDTILIYAKKRED